MNASRHIKTSTRYCLILLSVLVIFASGSLFISCGQTIDMNKLEELYIGMHANDVYQLLGKPKHKRIYRDSSYFNWIYDTPGVFSDALSIKFSVTDSLLVSVYTEKPILTK